MFLISGKHYYEVEVTDEGLCRIGWSTITADLELGECKPCVLPLLFERFGLARSAKEVRP